MIISCIESLVFNKSGVTCDFRLIRSVSTIFGSQSKTNLLLTGNFNAHLKIVQSSIWTSHVTQRDFSKESTNLKTDQTGILAGQLTKRLLRKNRLISVDEEMPQTGFGKVKALATAKEYNLESLMEGLLIHNLYVPKQVIVPGISQPHVIQVVPKYQVGHETREMCFFREGIVVMWNIPELESSNLLEFLKNYEVNSYSTSLVQAESESRKKNKNVT